MLHFLSLASGSSGNSYWFSSGETSFLIDAGVGVRTAEKILAEYGRSLAELAFILITHDHDDHIKALARIIKRYHIPVYTTSLLRKVLIYHHKLPSECLHALEKGVVSDVCGVAVTPFAIPHDASDTVAYFLSFDGKRILHLSDCGSVTKDVIKYARLSDMLIFEANYDERMLRQGSYPEILKQRIADPLCGHLSNSEAASALAKIYTTKTGRMSDIFLCHLSSNNNTPECALKCVREALNAVGATPDVVRLRALLRGKPSDMFSIE